MSYEYKNIKDVNVNTTPIRSNPDLSPYERETVILFNDDDNTASIDTAQVVVIKKLLNYPHFTPDDDGIILKDGNIVAVRGVIPRNCVRFTKEPRQRFDKI